MRFDPPFCEDRRLAIGPRETTAKPGQGNAIVARIRSMRPQSVDTPLEIEAIQLQRFREMGPGDRLAVAADLNEALDDLARAGIRARRQSIEIAPGTWLPFASAEDVVLQKLLRYRLGGGVSERQSLDALGVLKVQRERIDLEYLVRWAGNLELAERVHRALAEASVERPDPGRPEPTGSRAQSGDHA